MKRRKIASFALVVGMIATLVVAVAGTAVGQTTQARLAYVNGTSAEPLSVQVNGTEVVGTLDFASTSDADVRESGDASIVYSDGSTLNVPVPAATAWTVVSGFGDEGANAYQVTLAPIPSGKGVVVVWNAQTVDSLITVDGVEETVVAGAMFGAPLVVDAGTAVAVNVDGVDATVTPEEDQYIDVFGVSDVDATQVGVALAVIPSMTAILDALEPPPPAPDPTVPDVAGLSAADATAALVEAGFSVAETAESSDDVAEGVAIGTDPAAGSQTAAGSTVTLSISTGPSTVEVPDVTGQPVDDAVAELEGVGFTTSIEEQASDDVEEGIVISTNPRGGTEVAPASEVVVVVSTGPDDVEVPDFVGMTVDEANAAAEAVGLEPIFVEDSDDPDPEGLVVEQDPAAGELVPAGSEVTLQLSPATQDPWTSIKVEADGLLKAAGLNFLPESVSEVAVIDTSVGGNTVVDDDGFWIITLSMEPLDPSLAYEMLVTGTAEDGSPYEQTFKVPAVGEKVEEPVEDDSIPTWVWFVLGGILVAAIVLGVVLVTNSSGADEAAAAEAGTEGADGAAGDADAS